MLVYSWIASLDGFIEDASGSFDWSTPAEEVHAFVNDSPAMPDCAAIWQAADKVVSSTMLGRPETPRTRLERAFDPVRARKGGWLTGG